MSADRTSAGRLDGEMRARLRAVLEEEQVRLRAQLGDLEAAASTDEWLDDASDVGDLGSAKTELDQAVTLADNTRRILEQVTIALDRFEDGSYGDCELCDEPIPTARLEALPHATTCTDHLPHELRRH